MKTTFVFSVLLVVLLSIVSTDVNAHGRCGGYYRHCAPRAYCAPVQAYRPRVVYYEAPRYCPPPPPPRYYAREYYGRPVYRRHCRY